MQRARSGSETTTTANLPRTVGSVRLGSSSGVTSRPTEVPGRSLTDTISYNAKWASSFLFPQGSLYRRKLYIQAAVEEHKRVLRWFDENKPWVSCHEEECAICIRNTVSNTVPNPKPEGSHLERPLVQMLVALRSASMEAEILALLPSILRSMQRLTEFEAPENREQAGLDLFPDLTARDSNGGVGKLWRELNARPVPRIEQEHLCQKVATHVGMPSALEVSTWIDNAFVDIAAELSDEHVKLTAPDISLYAWYNLSTEEVQKHYKGLKAWEISLLRNTGMSRKMLDAIESIPLSVPNYKKVISHLKVWIIAVLCDPIIEVVVLSMGSELLALDMLRLLIVKIALGTLLLHAIEWTMWYVGDCLSRQRDVSIQKMLPLLVYKALLSLYDGTAFKNCKSGINFALKGPGLSSSVAWLVSNQGVAERERQVLTRLVKHLWCLASHKPLGEPLGKQSVLTIYQFFQTLRWVINLLVIVAIEGILMYHIKSYTKGAVLGLATQCSALSAPREAYFMSVIVRDALSSFIDDPKNLHFLFFLLVAYGSAYGII